jgi:beta-lactamase regulating signal transducer with metallopeptidase domain
MSDALTLLLQLNLAAAAAIIVVMALRLPTQRLFGARVAYGLWALVPLSAAAMLTPARTVTVVQAQAWAQTAWAAPATAKPSGVLATQPAVDWPLIAGGLWLAGCLLSLAWLAWRQDQFTQAMREGRAGPAVVGVLRPRIVIPADFANRYTANEQRMVLTHEQSHIARHDSRTNAAVALACCVGWFNPLLYLLAHYLRIDQEFACDARVAAAYPKARRTYAEAMLKTQLALRPLPLGCYWPARAPHPLAQRIDLLSRAQPSRETAMAGGTAVVVLALGAYIAVWAARPVDVVWVSAPRPAASPRAGAVEPPAPTSDPAYRPPAAARPADEPLPVASLAPEPLAAAAEAPATAPMDLARPQLVTLGGPGRPAQKIFGVAERSYVEPGLAIRVLATMADFDGSHLTTDLTSFASQKRYRMGYVERDDSPLKLFTAVVQRGDQLQVTASLSAAFAPWHSGSIVLASGQSGVITLPNGLQVNVTPTVRPETPAEIAEGQRDLWRDPRFRLLDRIVDAI